MSALQRLSLSYNKFEGSVPESLWQLSGLVKLDISSNALEGNISELHFSKLAKLEYLGMSNNSFKFSISSTWVPPFQLKTLRLSYISMEYSSFPYWLRNQENIDTIFMSNANLHGPAPEWFWKILANATEIDLSNNKIWGELPAFSSRLLRLDLSNNSLSGSLLNNWEQDSHLQYLDLSNNGFFGTIPSSFGNLTELEYLNLENNDLSGQLRLPMKNLIFLDLHSNRLSGKIVEWIGENVSNKYSPLEFMDLSNNVLSGTIPSSFGNLTELVSLNLGNNSLSGQLPLPMMNLKNMQFLDLHSNKLSGKIPSWMGENLSSLRILNLRSNLFHGEVGTGQLSRLASLQLLDLANNNLSGSIPKSFRNLKEMTNSDNNNSHSGFEFSGSMWIVMKGMELFYGDLRKVCRKSIDLSMNKLSGNIPEELTELEGLHNLNLFGNFLQGPIPDKIGELRNLESLDLSRNRLSGVIPPSLSAITFLEYLNVSNNNLSGKIPSSTQLQSFESSSYVGNEKLCGPPLSKKCPGDHETLQSRGDPDDRLIMSQEEEDEIKPWPLYIVTGSGFIGGICSVFGVLIVNKSWRDKFYKFSDDMFERFIVVVILWRIRIKRMLLK